MIGREDGYIILSISTKSSPANSGIREIMTTIPDILIMCIKSNILEFDIGTYLQNNLWEKKSSKKTGRETAIVISYLVHNM